MKVVLQRVASASVAIEGEVISEIKQGFLLLVGVKNGDTQEEADYLVNKISKLRVFEDEDERMNLSLADVKGDILSVSQFTLLANTRKGTRPSFVDAAKPAEATALYDYFNTELRAKGFSVLEGKFGADMAVSLLNDGPVTIIFDTENK